MYHPTASCFWDSDLERGIIVKPFSKTGCNIAPNLQNIVGDFNRVLKRLPTFKYCGLTEG